MELIWCDNILIFIAKFKPRFILTFSYIKLDISMTIATPIFILIISATQLYSLMAASFLLSSIPLVPPVSKVAPFSMAAPVAKVAPVSMTAPFSKVAPVASVAPIPSTDFVLPLSRSDFPKDFIFGTATSAYQIEGGKKSRGKSAWDHFSHTYPDKITDRSNGDIACNSYKLYMDDITLMNDMKTSAYRFSISWSRILPTGKLCGGIDQKGIDYYNHLINALIDNGQTPFVTLFHVDSPQRLEKEYGGFLSEEMAADFKDFADVCFEKFGDRVKNWITLNEPHTYIYYCYTIGAMAPGRCSAWQDLKCVGGDSATEPYIVAHNLLLAHALAVEVYNNKYKATQNGQIGITLDSLWCVPYSEKESDKRAALRGMDFVLGMFLEPLKSGKYPDSMQEYVGSRLTPISEELSQKLIGSYDFIGINYYFSKFAANMPEVTTPPSFITDSHVELTNFRGGIPIGQSTASGMYVYPRGLRDLLNYIKTNYNYPAIYITENGMAEYNDPSLSVEEACMDICRIDYYYRHLHYVHSAIKEHGVNVKGYFAWSLVDNYEWSMGYTVRFGMNFTDYNNDLKRYPKYSAKWFKQFLSS